MAAEVSPSYVQNDGLNYSIRSSWDAIALPGGGTLTFGGTEQTIFNSVGQEIDSRGLSVDRILDVAVTSDGRIFYAVAGASNIVGHQGTVRIQEYASGSGQRIKDIVVDTNSADLKLDVATFGQSEYLVVAFSEGGTNENDVFVQAFDLNLTVRQNKIQINDQDLFNQRDLTLATDEEGSILVAYEYYDGELFDISYNLIQSEELVNNTSPQGSVTINGSTVRLWVNQGETLTATDDLTDADGVTEFKYQWLANGTSI